MNILVPILHLLPIFYTSKMRISKAFFVFLGIFFCFFVCLSHALYTLRPGENLYGTETLVSASGVFELGFFGSSEPSNEYLGIWFTNDENKKAIWVLKDITMLQAMDAQNIRIMRKKMELQRLGLQRLLSTKRCRVVL